MKKDKKLVDINSWVGLVKTSGLNSLKYESQEIGATLKGEGNMINSVSLIDAQLDFVKKNYIILRKDGKNIYITDPEYLNVEQLSELEKTA